MQWSAKQIAQAKGILRKHSKYQDALAEIKATLDEGITKDSLQKAFRRFNEEAPSTFCKPTTDHEDALARLVSATRKGPVSVEDLCNKLNVAPYRLRQLIEEARAKDITIHVEHDHVGLRMVGPEARIQPVGIEPVIGKRQRLAVISDTHLGSKYVLREPLKDFVHYAYEQGVREILHAGDVFDGQYRHGTFEVSHVGLDAQAEDLYQTLPRLPGLHYRAITGNHDHTFTASSGVDVGRYTENYFRGRGRDDITFYGNRSAYLRIGGIVVHLWHPRSGSAYARSYHLQKQIERYSGGEKPNVLIAGHWHVHATLFERAVHAIAAPTFQGGGSEFANSLGGAPAIGGLVLSWDLTKHGTMRSFVHEYRAYYELEKPHHIDNDPAFREELPVLAAA